MSDDTITLSDGTVLRWETFDNTREVWAALKSEVDRLKTEIRSIEVLVEQAHEAMHTACQQILGQCAGDAAETLHAFIGSNNDDGGDAGLNEAIVLADGTVLDLLEEVVAENTQWYGSDGLKARIEALLRSRKQSLLSSDESAIRRGGGLPEPTSTEDEKITPETHHYHQATGKWHRNSDGEPAGTPPNSDNPTPSPDDGSLGEEIDALKAEAEGNMILAEQHIRELEAEIVDLKADVTTYENRATDLAAALEAQTRKNVLLREVVAAADYSTVYQYRTRLRYALSAAKEGGAL